MIRYSHIPLRLCLLLVILTMLGCKPGRTFTPFQRDSLAANDPVLDPEFEGNRSFMPLLEPVEPIVPVQAAELVPPPQLPESVEARPAKTILALSGGGSYGAFTAGVLNGWTVGQNRPEFDVVTGVSTGALIAPMAFLGPAYDNVLRKSYTEINRKDVFTYRNFALMPFMTSLASSKPLIKMVETTMTDELVRKIAAEHRKGRRLYIATTQLETRKNVIWDIGAIATRGTPEARDMIVKLLVASSSIPAVFPPVSIDVEVDGEKKTENHVDGGVTSNVFIPYCAIKDAAPRADLYVIIAGKYYPEKGDVRPRLFKVLKATGNALLAANTRRDVMSIYQMARLNGLRFHAVAIDEEFEIIDSRIDFTPDGMKALYAEGARVGMNGPLWESKPPEAERGSADGIRTGPVIKQNE